MLFSSLHLFLMDTYPNLLSGLTNMFDFVSTLLAGLRFHGANANLIYLLLEVWDSYL